MSSATTSPRATSPPQSPISKAALRSRSPPLAPLPSLSTTLPGLTAFDRAVHVVNISNMTSQGYKDNNSSDAVDFSAEDQLLLYGAYKQATKGDVKGLKPTFFDISARSKWQAWANLRGKSKEEATDIYVDIVVKALTNPDAHPDHIMLADEILQRPPTPPLIPQIPSIQDVIESNQNSTQDTPPPTSSSSSSTLRIPNGTRSAVPSIYELASETLEPEYKSYHEVTEMVVEEEILSDDYEEYDKEVQSYTTPLSSAKHQSSVHNIQNGEEEEEEEEEEVYQSSEEYEEDDESDGISITQPSTAASPVQPKFDHTIQKQEPVPQTTTQQQRRVDDFVDEGVFEEEEKEENLSETQDLVGSLEPVQDSVEKTLTKAPISRSGSISSGYGGSVLSDKDSSSIPFANTVDMLINGQDKESKIGHFSPPIEPYTVNIVHDASVSPLTLNHQNDQANNDGISQRIIDSSMRLDTPANTAAPESVAPILSLATPTVQSPPSDLPAASLPTTPIATTTLPTLDASPSTTTTNAPVDEPVCPVSKKTASSGGVCPAAMFAQARAAAAAEEAAKSSQKSSQATTTETDSTSTTSKDSTQQEKSASKATETTETALTLSTPSATPPSSNQALRIRQGIASRFTALRSSLAARAASSALLGGSSSSSSSTVDPNSVVVKDQVTQQPVTIVCPHLKSTQVLEAEVIRLQTDISVLHERLELLQQSLQIKSETRKQEQRSVRGIVKVILRQGLINAVLLFIVFAILYKRKSPIAYAILAYIGHSKKEGEAGWRALVRWTGEKIKTGQRNQQSLLRAGRRNGYW